MDGAITGWDILRREDIERSRAALEARPDYADLVAEAAKRGFRRITAAEQMEPGSADAYQWRGGVWVRQ